MILGFKNWKKAEIIEWLLRKGEQERLNGYTVVELRDMCKKYPSNIEIIVSVIDLKASEIF